MDKKNVPFKDREHSFNESLKIGDKGEAIILEKFPIALSKINEHYADFKGEDGKTYELKTDTYNPSTGNFFIERWSVYSATPKKDGGPWQSLSKGVDSLIYFYINHNQCYLISDLKGFTEFLDDVILPKAYLLRIKNRGYYGAGYLVKRSDVVGFIKEIRLV